MVIVPREAPLVRVLAPLAERAGLIVDREHLSPHWAIGSRYDRDALDHAADPTVDQAALSRELVDHGVAVASAGKLAALLVDREEVLDLSSLQLPTHRPPTLFERRAILDVVGHELAALLPASAVAIQRRRLEHGLNDCTVLPEGVARVRLLSTNGTTLAGRTHALVHELGHALIGLARLRGHAYGADYGHRDYGRWLDRGTWGSVMDEEALVRALADAWLLRRTAVTRTRTWPGAIDEPGRALDGDWLATFVRFRLRQGLGMKTSADDRAWLAGQAGLGEGAAHGRTSTRLPT